MRRMHMYFGDTDRLSFAEMQKIWEAIPDISGCEFAVLNRAWGDFSDTWSASWLDVDESTLLGFKIYLEDYA